MLHEARRLFASFIHALPVPLNVHGTILGWVACGRFHVTLAACTVHLAYGVHIVPGMYSESDSFQILGNIIVSISIVVLSLFLNFVVANHILGHA